MRGKISQATGSLLRKIVCSAILLFEVSVSCAQNTVDIEKLLNAFASDCPCCLDSAAIHCCDEKPCYFIFQGAHHNWIFIDAEVAGRVQLLDSLGRLYPLREQVVPRIIPIPNAPPMPGEKYPVPPDGYGVYAIPENNH